MSFNPANPLFVQSDKTLLLETNNPLFEEVRDVISVFAEIDKTPEHIHTYKLTPLSLWNAAALGKTSESIKESLAKYSKFDVPDNIFKEIDEYVSRYGRLKLIKEEDSLYLITDDQTLLEEVTRNKKVQAHLLGSLEPGRVRINEDERGIIKHILIQLGFPVEDLAGYTEGEPLEINVRDITVSERPFALRDYQREAVGAFWAGGSVSGGSGTIVLPCGAGKTIVAIGTMATVKSHTLVLTTNVTALRQWRREIIDKTDIDPELVGEYSGETKEIKPITITTYQLLTYRRSKESDFEHFHIFNDANWGLIVYDEVHLLPAPVFRAVSNLQSRRRLGLTATLVREDGKEDEVFSLIGPKKYDVPWRNLEQKGFIATATCTEIRVPFIDEDLRHSYAISEKRAKYKVAATNPKKLEIIDSILEKHLGEQILIIGQYIDQLTDIANSTDAPIITGKTPQAERDVLYKKFRTSEIPVLVVSKVANFAVDLPDASVAIQVSGAFGSRQEEAQRLGRILRPKATQIAAHFYTIVTRDTIEQEYAGRRQSFLTEQGYRYNIETVGV